MLKKYTSLILHIFLFVILTILTQIGGIIYFVTIIVKKKFNLIWYKLTVIGIGIYLATSFIILPLIAPLFGRVPLPFGGNLKPLNFGTVILNRHYVRPQLKSQMVRIANNINKEFNGTVTNYLDANFPFFDGFPLIPHLSHNDGRKLDLAFYYQKENKPSNSSPSFIGYGIYDDPKQGEENYPNICRQRGYWQYGFLSKIVSQSNKKDFQVDVKRTRRLIQLLIEDKTTSKLFIEPHLKTRWNLSQYSKIRFHGCQAVRHDDHIHTQIN